MGRLDLSFILATGVYSDLHLACTGKDGKEDIFKIHRVIVFAQCAKLKELTLESPVHHDEAQGVDVVHLDLDPEIFEGVLSFLYSGVYCIKYKAPETRVDVAGEGLWDDEQHSLFFSLRVCAMASELDLLDLFAESAAALCAGFEHFVFHVDFPIVLEELYSSLGKSPLFISHLTDIPRGVARNVLRFANVKKRLESVLLRQSNLAVDLLEATMDDLADTEERLQQAEDELCEKHRSAAAVPSIQYEDADEEEDEDREEDQGERRRRRSKSCLDDEYGEEPRPFKRHRAI